MALFFVSSQKGTLSWAMGFFKILTFSQRMGRLLKRSVLDNYRGNEFLASERVSMINRDHGRGCPVEGRPEPMII
jgi:hypothetical protein